MRIRNLSILRQRKIRTSREGTGQSCELKEANRCGRRRASALLRECSQRHGPRQHSTLLKRSFQMGGRRARSPQERCERIRRSRHWQLEILIRKLRPYGDKCAPAIRPARLASVPAYGLAHLRSDLIGRVRLGYV
jgi:hypothetical protein